MAKSSLRFSFLESFSYKVRQLEEDLYSTYVPNDFLCSNAVVYQWLIENKVHYNFNFTITKEMINLHSLVGYAIIVITLSAIGSALWEGISKLISFL